MVITEAEKDRIKKLVDNDPLSLRDLPALKRRATKKRVRRIAEPHIRAHQVKGHIYYTYCRGTDKEIYLGDANTILKAVKRTGLNKAILRAK